MTSTEELQKILDSPEGTCQTNKSLLLRHIEESTQSGTPLGELQEVLPSLSRYQVQTLRRELKREDSVEVRGATRAARWFPVPKRNSTQ